MMGVISSVPFPTYPDGFPNEIIEKFSAATGRGVLCNKPYSGTAVINDYGDEHLHTGALIVYTSADSVFQIAAHEDIVPPEKLYEYCRIARDILVGEHAVGRVIARPFEGEAGAFKRTARRHDFSLEPTGRTLLDAIKESGLDSIAVGKISDIFAARGISESIPTVSNADGMAKTEALLERDFNGLCFVNLVDFDMTYGHRNDVDGYAAAMSEFDLHLGRLLPKLGEGDVLMITADHGCDPAFTQSTDHSRECVPWLILGKGVKKINLGTKHGFNHIAAAVASLLGVDYDASCADVTKDILES
jgi:phosphopentomutase